MKDTAQVEAILIREFERRHIKRAVGHFAAAVEKFAREDWEGVFVKSGKFIEAVTKALMVYCGKVVPSQKKFRASNELGALSNVSTARSEIIRILIPKALLFAYDVANNRGGRHDPDGVDPNAMDVEVVMPVISWVLAEMVRFCSSDDTVAAAALVARISKKKYPFFEEINGRRYVSIPGLTPGDYALLLMYDSYPSRVGRSELTDWVQRHGGSSAAVRMAIQRLCLLVDDDDSTLILRITGRKRAEELLRKHVRTD